MGKYYRKYLGLFIIGIFADILVDYLQLLVPEYLGAMVEMVQNYTGLTLSSIAGILKALIVVSLLLFGGRMLMRFSILKASTKIESDVRHDMFLKTERLSQRFFHKTKAGSIMSSFTTDVEAIEEFAGWGTIMIVDALFLSTLSLYKMIRLDRILTLIVIVPMAALIVWGNIAERSMSQKWMERQENFDRLFDFTQENFTGIRVIKAFVKEAQEFVAFRKVAKDNSDKNIEFAMLNVRLDVSIEVLIGAVMAIILGAGGYFVYRCSIGNPFMLWGYTVNISAGKLVTFIGYVDTLVWPMIAMGQILQMYSRFRASSKRIKDFMNEEEEICDHEGSKDLIDCQGRISFNHFSFTYPDSENEVLHDISLVIEPGELIGVVGKIGSGKTTLVNTLLHLYNIEKEQIFIDDTDLMDIRIDNLRDNIAYVPQDNFLFSDSVQNNISFSNRKMSPESIKKAAVFADVHDNIVGFSGGYETMTGERGVTLSGGQKQRISIARAYAKDAPIMILDDSVSAVDVKTEETIIGNILTERKGKTTIVIASRLSTVAKADRILVLNQGRVEAFDKPERLLEISDTYKRMNYLQQLESEL